MINGSNLAHLLWQSALLAVLAAAVFSAAFFAGFWLYRRVSGEMPFPRRRWFVLTLFVGWSAAAAGLTLLFRLEGTQIVSRANEVGVNLTLLRSAIIAWNSHTLYDIWLDVLNLLLFVPFGFLLPFLRKKTVSARTAALVSLAVTTGIETAQLVLHRGFFDVEDLLHNWLGGMLGYFLAVFLLDWVRVGRPLPKLFLRVLAVPLVVGVEMLLGVAACRLQGFGVLSAAPKKETQTVLSAQKLLEPPEDPLSVPAFLLFPRSFDPAYINRIWEQADMLDFHGSARMWYDIDLPVPFLEQNPDLRNGCEATSLAALLNYKGVRANKLDLAYGYIPREDFEETKYGPLGPDPERAYPGDPATPYGFYCFAAPVVEGANLFLRDEGSSLRAVNVTGVTGAGLERYLRGGDPVIVWVTLDLTEPHTGDFAWIIRDTEEIYVPYMNLHCVVLMGWGRDTCEIMDPIEGIRTVEKEAFLKSFEEVGRRAVVIH